MLHACNAVDGTSAKVFPNERGNAQRFTKFLRDSYPILFPMSAPGVDPDTRWPAPTVKSTLRDGRGPDLADIIYYCHRCTHAHGDELLPAFELIPDARGPAGITTMWIGRNIVQLSDRIIFGLIAAVVFSPVNLDQRIDGGHFLTFGKAAMRLPIDDWWGQGERFLTDVVPSEPMPLLRFDWREWMA